MFAHLPSRARGILRWHLVAGVVLAFMLTACGEKAAPVKYARMGEAIVLGDVEHAVLVADWRGSIGEGPSARVPENQFLVLRIALSNEADRPAEMASLRLIADDGTEYEELADGSGLADWLGLVRTLSAKESRNGDVLFDAPRGVYKLKLAEHSADGDEINVAMVEIPVRVDQVLPAEIDPTKSNAP